MQHGQLQARAEQHCSKHLLQQLQLLSVVCLLLSRLQCRWQQQGVVLVELVACGRNPFLLG